MLPSFLPPLKKWGWWTLAVLDVLLCSPQWWEGSLCCFISWSFRVRNRINILIQTQGSNYTAKAEAHTCIIFLLLIGTQGIQEQFYFDFDFTLTLISAPALLSSLTLAIVYTNPNCSKHSWFGFNILNIHKLPSKNLLPSQKSFKYSTQPHPLGDDDFGWLPKTCATHDWSQQEQMRNCAKKNWECRKNKL